jgi:hypothetical protein
VSLGIFREFLGFSYYFSCFKVFSGLFLELLMHWKIISEKKQNLSFPTWAEPEGPIQSIPAQPPGPQGPSATQARQAEPWPWPPPLLGVRTTPSPTLHPIKWLAP